MSENIDKIDALNRIKEAKELLDMDAITENEFNQIKNKYLKQIREPNNELKNQDPNELTPENLDKLRDLIKNSSTWNEDLKKGALNPDNKIDSKELFKLNNNPYTIDYKYTNSDGSLFPVCLSYSYLERLVDYDDELGFLCKSINLIDSFNGSAMSIIRGDDFNLSDCDNFLTLSRAFQRDAIKINEEYYNNFNTFLKFIQNDPRMLEGVTNPEQMIFYVTALAHKYASENINFDNVMEEYKEKFNNINCNLEWTPQDITTENVDTYWLDFLRVLNE